MAHVVYIHINQHGVLQNVGMKFDSHYDVRAEMLPLRDNEFHRRDKGTGRVTYGSRLNRFSAEQSVLLRSHRNHRYIKYIWKINVLFFFEI